MQVQYRRLRLGYPFVGEMVPVAVAFRNGFARGLVKSTRYLTKFLHAASASSTWDRLKLDICEAVLF